MLRWGRAAPVAILALVLVEAAVQPRPAIRPREFPGSYASLIAAQSDIADFLKRQTGWFRVSFDENAVPYNFGNLYGIEQFDGYLASMPERLQRVLGDPRTRVATAFGTASELRRPTRRRWRCSGPAAA